MRQAVRRRSQADTETLFMETSRKDENQTLPMLPHDQAQSLGSPEGKKSHKPAGTEL